MGASGEPISGAEFVAAIRRVTTADVKKVASSMLAAPATLVHHGASDAAPTLANL
eukprot:NODE_8660_length_282_cov_226.751073_g7920_i0.p3 GENE.NODE_8660_length_282_cov_226.751073_g7920_i0~~NODE_8660_length_282_cov_226.751073_g7920_i0.p3  ORF type:complete len:55 (-),score=18.68 NODE_8660_length_282_cov_226.751073_g7920_i0:88-252(-)